MIITLHRFAHLQQGELGWLEIPNGPMLYTLERPWVDNKPFISCLPYGDYPLECDKKGRIRDVPGLRNTEPRWQINIHKANYVHELHGCIAVGMEWEVKKQEPMVWSSGEALDLLLEVIADKALTDGSTLLDKEGEAIILRIRNQ